ncbi:hypothetical protein GCM10009677_11690 [Sphaerisporangium rubeum]|uniref:Dynamin family protein n=1 Tax=Sphaerisporangium rubeum TaxID=321317 RepID=A0A7X0IBK7_9ACTN|nr:hypothetical protein [Sphaerisporangium rubeum]MBB6472211.1 hypothetical protein [Sphaerisporangium rubeum]
MTDDSGTWPGVTVGDQVKEWLDGARAVARTAGMDAASDEVDAIVSHALRMRARVVVTSTSSRLRSWLVNELLGRTVLPADPGADVPIVITPGRIDHLEAETAGGPSARRLTADDHWHRDGDPEVAAFRLQLHDDTLEQGGLDLATVSASAESCRNTRSPARSVLASADAVVMPVTATSAMTMTDMTFLEELFRLGVSPARVLVVLSRLELVEEDDRAEVLNYVTRRAAKLSPLLTVVPAEVAAEQEIAAGVRAWITDTILPTARTARIEHIGRRITQCLASVRATAEQAMRDAAAERERLAGETAGHRSRVADRLRIFDELAVDVQSKQNQVLDDLRRERDRFREELTASVLHQVDRAGDPKEWMEAELPYQLETRLAAWDGNVRKVLHATTGRHLDEVTGALATSFGLRLDLRAEPLGTGPAIPVMGDIRLDDLRQRKLLYRMGPTGVALLAALLVPGFGPPAALIASLVGTGLAEVRLRTLVNEQRALLRKRLPGVVDAALDPHTDTITDHLSRVYRHVHDEVLRLRNQWRATMAEPAVTPLPAAPDWPAVVAGAEELTATIRAGADVVVFTDGRGVRR